MKIKLLVIHLFVAVAGYCQEALLSPFLQSITKEELSEHIYTLASDSMGGRKTGSPGQDKAAAYIERSFTESGIQIIEPAISGSYAQNFDIMKVSWKPGELRSGDKIFKIEQDYLLIDKPETEFITGGIVFVGYGIDDPKYSDYKNLKVDGKIVAAFSGEPKDSRGNSIITGTEELSGLSYHFSKFRTAKEKGAIGFLLISASDKDFDKYMKKSYRWMNDSDVYLPGGDTSKSFVGLYMKNSSAAELFGLAPDPLSPTMKISSLPAVSLATQLIYDPLKACNVVAVIEGKDKKDEAVVVIAHYDHLGTRDGRIYNGADDNATGTAAVLEIAEAFSLAAKEGFRPRRSVIFLLVTGEEMGLLGSEYYTMNPVIPLENTTAAVNIDMIGRSSKEFSKSTQYIAGWGYVSEDIVEAARKGMAAASPDIEFLMKFSARKGGGSDHYHFAKNGIPSLFYFTGIHSDYHSPDDTADKILYLKMEKIVRGIFATVWELANR